MHDRRDLMLGKDGCKPFAVGDVALDQRSPTHRVASAA